MLLHFESHGDIHKQHPLVLLGSVASTLDMWRPQITALAAAGFPIIAVDHRGHGASADPIVEPCATTMADLASDVLETLDSLGVTTFDVAGLSLGGAIAQYLAATCERVRKAAFLCTAAFFGGPEKWEARAELTRAEGMGPMADMIAGLWITPEFAAANPSIAEELRGMIVSTRGVGYASCADALGGWDFRARLGEITVPVLTLAGEQDLSTPPADVHAIGEGTSGKHTAMTIPGAHVPTVEQPEMVTDALAAHFAD